jgi:endonuclease/exonuclease/phosphatase family metal-dependent hydrolase
MTVRVASYNTRDFLDDRRAAARVVRALAPDVLLLQEAPRRFWPGPLVRDFARETGLRWPGGHRGSGGTTVMLSDRLTLVDCVHRGLPVPLGQRTRGYAVLRARLPEGSLLTAASVHLGLFEGQRLRHTHQILRDLPVEGPLVVAGDLNEGPGGPSWQTFAGLLDVLSVEEPTYPSWAPVEMLDVVWGRGVRRVDGTPPPELDRRGRDVRRASDHLPVWVDVDVLET